MQCPTSACRSPRNIIIPYSAEWFQLHTLGPILGMLLVMILMWCTLFSSTCQFKLNITASSGSESSTEIEQLLQHFSTEKYRKFFLLQSQNRSLICNNLSPLKENNLLLSPLSPCNEDQRYITESRIKQ